MTWYDEFWDGVEDFFEDANPSPDVNELLFGNEYIVDQHAQDLFREAFFEDNDRAYIDLIDYMWEVYGMDFEEAFSWEDFREWYESQ